MQPRLVLVWRCYWGPGYVRKELQHRWLNKSRPCRIHMMASSVLLLMGIEPLRHDEMQMIFCAGHCHVEQTAFFLDFLRRASGEIRWNTAVHAIENKHGLPFLALGRMNGRENEVIVVQQRCASLITGGIRRI